MENILKCLRALGDENRLRIVMLLSERELCVCQLMGVLGISQPLVSRHLAVLKAAGVVASRRDGKLMYYCLSEEARAGGKSGLFRLIGETLRNEPVVLRDLTRLRECSEIEKRTGRCSMETFREYAQNGGLR